MVTIGLGFWLFGVLFRMCEEIGFMMRVFLAVFFVTGTLAPSDDPPGDINAKVLAFARSKMGEQVGDGKCAALVRSAYQETGAKPRLPKEPGESFAWGDPVASVKEARPGDVVVFDKVSFRGRRRIIADDGSPRISITTQMFPQHVAIVAAVGPKGKTLMILHQNVGQPDGSSETFVQEARLVMSEMRKGGSMTIFRPIAPEP